MLRELQGRRKRYVYDQAAAIALEHVLDGPMDPTTQLPIWRDMIAATKGATMPKAEFMRRARAFLCKASLFDADTMAA